MDVLDWKKSVLDRKKWQELSSQDSSRVVERKKRKERVVSILILFFHVQ
jgi:hypothetical protein